MCFVWEGGTPFLACFNRKPDNCPFWGSPYLRQTCLEQRVDPGPGFTERAPDAESERAIRNGDRGIAGAVWWSFQNRFRIFEGLFPCSFEGCAELVAAKLEI